jgi:hypothetical protein
MKIPATIERIHGGTIRHRWLATVTKAAHPTDPAEDGVIHVPFFALCATTTTKVGARFAAWKFERQDSASVRNSIFGKRLVAS